MKKIHIIYMLCFSIVFYFCSDSNINENNLESGLNFYFLKDSTITANQIYNSSLDELILADTPFITSKDIKFYKWSDHSFSIDTNKVISINKKCKNNTTVFGIPFVVTVDKERIYRGAFWFPISSIIPEVPYIDVGLFDYGQTHGTLVINKRWNNDEVDRRNDIRIYNMLKKSGLLTE